MSTRSRGFTMIEAILAIVIVATALTGVLSVFILTAQNSADPMVQQQAQFIAESYLDEILRQKFYDPDTDTICPAAEGARSLYDNICDYNGLSQVPTDAFGSALPNLGAYSVLVSVVTDNSVALSAINNTGVIRVLRVDVTVTGPAGTSITLSGYRTNYNCNAAGDPGCKS